MRRTSLLLGTIVCVPLLYVSACSYIDRKYDTAIEAIKTGDTKERVIEEFGRPTFAEDFDHPFAGYATDRCQPPCAERLWFENRMLPLQAWSVSIGNDGRIVDKYKFVSP